MEPRNRCQGINSASLCSLAGRYDNPIPTRCLAPIEFLKIPALNKKDIESKFSLALFNGTVGSVNYFSFFLSTRLTFSHQPGQAKVNQHQNLSISLCVRYINGRCLKIGTVNSSIGKIKTCLKKKTQ
jgi:hypothetical protein